MLFKKISLFILSLLPTISLATVYQLPTHSDIVGHVQLVTVKKGDSLTKLARQYDISTVKIKSANPKLAKQKYLKLNQTVVIPTRYILPKIRQGIVVNLTELRLYYFPEGKHIVITYPVALGRMGWRTPTAKTLVYKKKKNPEWRAPKSIWNYTYKKYGKKLPKVMPSGPENPLGYYALYLSKWGYLIHGNNDPSSIGRYVSSGCIRLYNDDIEQLFYQVPVKTQVFLIHHSLKVGADQRGNLYLESERGFDKTSEQSELNQTDLQHVLAPYQAHMQINWHLAERVANNHRGIPVIIGHQKQRPQPHDTEAN